MSPIPFVSIIIPAYNAEKYLPRCVASLSQQTFEDFEVIIINDGSTDDTGLIADEWSQRNPRAKVIHTPNRGVAEARNMGLRHVEGRYIGFVDSDDWVEPEMFEMLVKAIEKDTADIAICGHQMETDEGALITSEQLLKKSEVWTAHEALVKLLMDYKIKSYLWDKLFKRELFEGVSFPTGGLMEDQRVLYELLAKASKVTYIHEPLYHYIQRGDSILGSKSLTIDIDYLYSQLNLFRYVESSDAFSSIEHLVLHSTIAMNIIIGYRNLKKNPSPIIQEEAERLLNLFKATSLYHYQKHPFFYKNLFKPISKLGRKML